MSTTADGILEIINIVIMDRIQVKNACLSIDFFLLDKPKFHFKNKYKHLAQNPWRFGNDEKDYIWMLQLTLKKHLFQ